MGGDGLLGPIPGLILLTGVLLAVVFYYFQNPQTHPSLGEKIVKGDDRFETYKNAGLPVLKASCRPPENEDTPSTRSLFLYFQAKGYAPVNEEYEYIALPPTRRDWIVEFGLWLLIPVMAAVYLVGERALRIVLIALFLGFIALPVVIVYTLTDLLFGSPIGEITAILTAIATVILVATRFKNTRLFQWMF